MELGTIRRLHSASGLWLGAYLLFHAWEHWPVRHGRDALLARLSQSRSAVLEVGLVLVPLAAHAIVGVWLLRRADTPHAYASPAFRRLQVATGVAALLFVLFHVVGVWLPSVLEPTPLGAAYGAARAQTGTMAGMVLYVVGLAAVCTHFGQGVGAALVRLSAGRLAAKPARIVGVALGVGLYLVLVNELASYATGARLL